MQLFKTNTSYTALKHCTVPQCDSQEFLFWAMKITVRKSTSNPTPPQTDWSRGHDSKHKPRSVTSEDLPILRFSPVGEGPITALAIWMPNGGLPAKRITSPGMLFEMHALQRTHIRSSDCETWMHIGCDKMALMQVRLEIIHHDHLKAQERSHPHSCLLSGLEMEKTIGIQGLNPVDSRRLVRVSQSHAADRTPKPKLWELSSKMRTSSVRFFVSY